MIKIIILTGTEMCQARVDFNLSVLVGLALYVWFGSFGLIVSVDLV